MAAYLSHAREYYSHDGRPTSEYRCIKAAFVLTAVTRLASGYAIGDVVNGFSAISRQALEKVDWNKAWPGYGYPIDFLIRFSQVGLRAADVPQRTIYLAGERQSQIKSDPLFPRRPSHLGAGALRASDTAAERVTGVAQHLSPTAANPSTVKLEYGIDRGPQRSQQT